MKKILILSLLLIILGSCKDNTKKANNSEDNGSEQQSFITKEFMAAGSYVYILGEESGELRWFAVTARDVQAGDVYYYEAPLIMTDFYSKELDRPFDEVVFLSRVSKNPLELAQTNTGKAATTNKSIGKITTEKLNIDIDIPENAISIARLYEEKDHYQGKKATVRGQVVKFSPKIMNTNWIHIQDGTSFEGKFDLTITSNETVELGDIITFEGVVAVDKDFGYGYFYELLLEKAKVIK